MKDPSTSDTPCLSRQPFSFEKLLSCLFYFTSFVLFLYITICVWLNTGNPILFGVGAFIYLLFFIGLYYIASPFVDGLSRKTFTYTMAVLFIFFFLSHLYIAWNMRYSITHDTAIVFSSIPSFMVGEVVTSNDHFVMYPNNIGLLVLLGLTYKIASLFGIAIGSYWEQLPGMLLNILLLTITVLFICKFVFLIWKKQSAVLLAYIVCFAFLPFFLWAPNFYTSSISLPFPVVSAYFFLCFLQADDKKRQYFYLIVSAVIVCLGFIMKGTVAVCLVAFLVTLLLHKGFSFKKRTLFALVFTLVFSVSYMGFHTWYKHSSSFDFSYQDTYGQPLEVWLVFGAQGTGAWNGDVRAEIMAEKTVAAREILARSIIKETYAAYTPSSYFTFWSNKMVRTWGDGKFGSQEMLTHPLSVNFTQYFVFEQFFPYKILSAHGQFYLLMLYISFVCLLGYNIKYRKNSFTFLLSINLFGLLFFLTFWEAWPSYILSFTPFLLLAFVWFIMQTQAFIPKIKTQLKRKKETP